MGHIAKAFQRQKQNSLTPYQQNHHQSKSTHQVGMGDGAILEDPTDGSYELLTYRELVVSL